MVPAAPLENLAAQLYTAAKEITTFCEQRNYPQRSFDRIEPSTLLPADASESVLVAQQSINELTTKLQQLVTDPNDFMERFQVQVSPGAASLACNTQWCSLKLLRRCLCMM